MISSRASTLLLTPHILSDSIRTILNDVVFGLFVVVMSGRWSFVFDEKT